MSLQNLAESARLYKDSHKKPAELTNQPATAARCLHRAEGDADLAGGIE
jgi:hypothetical protein